MNEVSQVTYPRPIKEIVMWACMNLGCPVTIHTEITGQCPSCKGESLWRLLDLYYTRENLGGM